MKSLVFGLIVVCGLVDFGFAKQNFKKSSASGLHRRAVFGYVGRAVDRLYPFLKSSIGKKEIASKDFSSRPLRIALAVVQVSESLGTDLKGFIHRKMLSRNYRLNTGHWMQFVECIDCANVQSSETEEGGLLIDRGGTAFPVSKEAVAKYQLDYYLTVNIAYNGAVMICKMSVYDAETNLLLGSKSEKWWVGNLRTFAFQSGMYFIPYFLEGKKISDAPPEGVEDAPKVVEKDDGPKNLKLGAGLYLGGRVYRAVEVGLDFLGVILPDAPEDAPLPVVEGDVPPVAVNKMGGNLFQWGSSHFSLGLPFWEYTSLPVGIFYPVLGIFLGIGFQNAYENYNPLFFSYGGFLRLDFGLRVNLMLKWMSNTSKKIVGEDRNAPILDVTNQMFPSYVSVCVGINFS